MARVYLPLLPLPVLAVLVAVSACSKPRSEETTHVIPPAAPWVASSAAIPVPLPTPAPAPAAGEDVPSPEDVKEFERAVGK
jgi:hypothetical protein